MSHQMMRNPPRLATLAALLMSSAMLAGCAETNFLGHFAKKTASDDGSPPASKTVGGVYKVGKPYQVGGVWYYPREDWEYDETGIASWYGPNFHGKLTATGEEFDQDDVTAAHKTLPMPSVARVTNLENGRSLVVRINDRGPFVNGRIIDLSRRSAQLLGIDGPGTARVRVQVMPDESRVVATNLRRDTPEGELKVAAAPRAAVTAEALPGSVGGNQSSPRPVVASAPASAAARNEVAQQAVAKEIGQVKSVPVHATNIFVQAGAFSNYNNALRATNRLSGIGRASIVEASVKGQTIYRVRLGPTSTVNDADAILDRVIAAGHPDARVVVD